MKKLIGYLNGTGTGKFVVDCPDCAKEKVVEVHDTDIGEVFKQSCRTCKKVLVNNSGPDLFDGIK